MYDFYVHDLICKLRRDEVERRLARRCAAGTGGTRPRPRRTPVRERAAAALITLALWLAPAMREARSAERYPHEIPAL